LIGELEEKPHSRDLVDLFQNSPRKFFTTNLTDPRKPGGKSDEGRNHWKCCIHLGW
jgi:hypothetical protein